MIIKRTLRIFVTTILSLCIVSLSFATMVMVDNTKHVHDLDGLISLEEVAALEQHAKEASDRYEIPIIVAITNDSLGLDSKTFADEFYEQNRFSSLEGNTGMILLIDMDSRMIDVESYGRLVNVFSDRDIDNILDNITDKMIDTGSIYLTAEEFLLQSEQALELKTNDKNVEEFILPEVPEGAANYGATAPPLSITEKIARNSFIGLIVSGVIMAIMVLFHKKTVPLRVSAAPYISRENIKYRVKQDRFLDTRTSVTRIRTDNNNSGGGGGRSSSGGFSSSGGSASRGGSRSF